jgi:ketosteroid isomerase-like protein
MKRLLLLLALVAFTGCASVGETMTVGDPLRAAEAFDNAIASGDEAQAKELLAPDVLIYEAGGQETSRDEYASHHMKGDMAFMAKVKSTVLDRKSGTAGDLAWVATRRQMTGMHKDKPLDIFSTETLVLKHESAGWRIVHIQWSSRPVKPKPAEPKAP